MVTDIGIELCGAFGGAAMRKAAIPLIHHLDHSNRPELCRAAVDNGYPSVMIDASSRPLEENIAVVKPVADYAHPHGVLVEGEVGRIKGAGVEGRVRGRATSWRGWTRWCASCGRAGWTPWRWASARRTASTRAKPEIHFDRLGEINAAVSVPLVLHGGTGIPEQDVRRAIRGGINKVNVGTIIHCTYMNAVRAELQRLGENAYTLDVMPAARAAVREEVKKWIRVCMADGKGD